MTKIQRPVKQPAWITAAWALALALFAATSSASAGEWPFVLPKPGDPFEHPPLRALVLSTAKPDDVKEMVHYRGARRRYAQIRYGSPGSVRITVVLDELRPGEVELYVDADRNRRIEEKDRVACERRTWRLPMAVAVVDGEMTKLTPRAAIFRLGATGLTFSFAAAGYVEGTVNLGGRKHAARRSDGDGNGFLTDAQDRLWIDLNDDGRWDPTEEQFLYTTILTLGPARYAVRSDELGTRLAMEAVEGTGTVRLNLNRPAGYSHATALHTTLIGRDGSAVGLSGEGERVTVPAGEYRVGTLSLSFDDPDGGLGWSFIFSDSGAKSGHKWYQVDKGRSVEIDPVGRLVMETGVEQQGKSVPAGDDIPLQPRLYTGDGLLINTCFRGSPATPGGHDGQGADIKLTGAGEQALGVARSGFA
ncbi:MAG: hypothetical protein ACHRXM_17990 [Isosphaerales bacterium]